MLKHTMFSGGPSLIDTLQCSTAHVHFLEEFLPYLSPNQRPLREAEKRSEEVYEKKTLFEIEEQYNKTEAGRIQSCISSEGSAINWTSPIQLTACFNLSI